MQIFNMWASFVLTIWDAHAESSLSIWRDEAGNMRCLAFNEGFMCAPSQMKKIVKVYNIGNNVIFIHYFPLVIYDRYYYGVTQNAEDSITSGIE